MTEREVAVNRDLRALDDAHRLGQIQRAEYRARRRNVLAKLADAGAATERNPLQAAAGEEGFSGGVTVKKMPAQTAVTRPTVMPAKLRAAEPTPPTAKMRESTSSLTVVALLVIVLLVVALGAYLLWERSATRRAIPQAVVAAGAATGSGHGDVVTQTEAAVRTFLTDDRWDAEVVDRLTARWTANDAATRAELRGRPIFGQLRDHLDQRRKVVDLLLEGASPDDPKARDAASLKSLDAALAAP